MDTLLLTPEQAAAELQIARRRIFEMISNGTLPSIKIGKSRRISRTALQAYIKGLETGIPGVATPVCENRERPAAGLGAW
jgi:excisionase family DNA binding protein